MVVVEVWGRVDGIDSLPLKQEGDNFWFAVPESFTYGELVCEFWARDDYGNVSYKSAIVTVSKGSIKCIRWIDDHSTCIQRNLRPCDVMDITPRPCVTDVTRGTEAVCITVRPDLTMQAFKCPMMEA